MSHVLLLLLLAFQTGIPHHGAARICSISSVTGYVGCGDWIDLKSAKFAAELGNRKYYPAVEHWVELWHPPDNECPDDLTCM